jgi:hypothetical protein
VPEHAVETKWPQFSLAWIPSKTQRRKVADCWVEISKNIQDLPRPAPRNSQDPIFCDNFISNFFLFFLIADFRNFIKIFFQVFVSNLKRKRIWLTLGVSRNSAFLFWGILKENLETENWKNELRKIKVFGHSPQKKKNFELDFEKVLLILDGDVADFPTLKTWPNKKILQKKISQTVDRFPIYLSDIKGKTFNLFHSLSVVLKAPNFLIGQKKRRGCACLEDAQ